MTQGIRHNQGKPQWSQIHWKSLEPMIRVLEQGAKEVGKDNWKKGLPVLEVCESLLRHTFALMDGEDNDQKSGEPHIGHILANAMFLSYMMQFKPEMDNRREKEEPKGGVLDESNFRQITEDFAVRLRRDVNTESERLIIERASPKLSSRIKRDLAIEGNRIQTIMYGRRVDLLYFEGEWWEIVNSIKGVLNR